MPQLLHFLNVDKFTNLSTPPPPPPSAENEHSEGADTKAAAKDIENPFVSKGDKVRTQSLLAFANCSLSNSPRTILYKLFSNVQWYLILYCTILCCAVYGILLGYRLGIVGYFHVQC